MTHPDGKIARILWYVPVTTGTPRTRALAAALRHARESTGQSLRAFAREAGLQHASLSLWETGNRVPRTEDVATILAHLGVVGDERERILELARHASEQNWLAPGVSEQLDGVMECERTATRIVDWSPLLIPGLLQTYDYAHAVFGADKSLSSKEVETSVTLRLGRRNVLTSNNSTSMSALISERALHKNVRNVDATINQLNYLKQVSEWDSVTLQIVRAGNDWAGLTGPFVLYEFDDAPPIVHLEHLRSGVFLYDDDDVCAFQDAAATLEQAAMNPVNSIEFITDLAAKMESER